MTRLRVTVLLGTNTGGLWVLPQVRELRRRGHDVTVVLPAGPGRLTSALTAQGFPVVASPVDFRFRGARTLRGLWRLRRLIRRLRPDVLNYHLYASALAARFSTLGLRLRTAHLVADPRHLESPLVRAVERLLWRMDDVTICCTEQLSRRYRRLGAPGDRVRVAQHGIDVGYFSPPPVGSGAEPVDAEASRARAERRAKARAEIGMDDAEFVVVMVGSVHTPPRPVHRGRDRTGDDLLLDAWRAFHTRHPRSHLLLIGEEFAEPGEAYRRRCAVDGDPAVTRLGWVPDLRAYLTAADLGVVPSLPAASDGVVRAASATGLPTIVCDAGGRAVDYRCGWVVPRGDARALGAALDAAHREFAAGTLAARGEHARRRARRLFGDRAAAARVVDIIEAVGRAGSAAPRPARAAARRVRRGAW